MIAEVITLIGGAPELPGGGVNGFAYAVADAGSVNLKELAFRSEFKDVSAVKLVGVGVGVIDVGS